MVRNVPLLIFLLALAACSPRTLALRETVSLLDRGAVAFYEESDPQLAREAMASQLKLLEALLQNDPSNQKLLLLASQGFNGYAFLFLEESEPERAKNFYLRGRNYALRVLDRRSAFKNMSEKDESQIASLLSRADRTDVPALFWAAFGWAGFINLSKDSPQALAELPKAVALMNRVENLDPDYQFAGSSVFFGVYYASRPALLGGDVRKAAEYFKEAARRTSGQYLMTYVLEAKSLAVSAQDKELFKMLLGKVARSPAGQLANARLADEVAKIKAARLMERINDLF